MLGFFPLPGLDHWSTQKLIIAIYQLGISNSWQQQKQTSPLLAVRDVNLMDN